MLWWQHSNAQALYFFVSKKIKNHCLKYCEFLFLQETVLQVTDAEHVGLV